MTDTVHLYVYDGFVDWEPAFAIAGIHAHEFQREPRRWQVKTVGPARESPVRSLGGLTVLPDMGLDDVKPSDSRLFIIPGGPGWETPSEPRDRVVRHAKACLEAGVPVAAICGATAGLARAGLLDERHHTSNAKAYLVGVARDAGGGPGYHGEALYRDEPVMRDDSLITAGGMSPLEFAKAIFEELALFDEPVLEAWYQLYKTGRSEYFAHMNQAARTAH